MVFKIVFIQKFIDYINTGTNYENILEAEENDFIAGLSDDEKRKLLAYEMLEDDDTLTNMDEESYIQFLNDLIVHNRRLTMALAHLRPIKDSIKGMDLATKILLYV